MFTILGKGSRQKYLFLGLCPKLLVGGGQESRELFSENTMQCYMLYLTIASINFFYNPTFHFWNSKSAGWVGRICCLGESPKKYYFFTASLIVNAKCYIHY